MSESITNSLEPISDIKSDEIPVITRTIISLVKECGSCGVERDIFFFVNNRKNCIYCPGTRKNVCDSVIRFHNKITKLGGKITGQYRNNSTPVVCRCMFGHMCSPSPNNVQRGQGMCKVCARRDPITARENFHKQIANLGGTVVGQYRGNHASVNCRCALGHTCNPIPANIQQGQGMCLICAGNDPETAKNNFFDGIAKLGGTVIGQYQKYNIPVECTCASGHTCNPLPYAIQQGQGMCRICAGRDPATARDNFFIRIAELGGTVMGQYRGNNIPVECICASGHTCTPRPGGIQQGKGMCSSCGLKSEPLCRSIFEEIFKCKFPKARPDWLQWETGKCLELDGYNEELKIAFEYQGIQHEKYSPYFHPNGEEDFEYQVEKDLFKARMCAEQGVQLFAIPSKYNYTDPDAMYNIIVILLAEAGF